MKKILFQKLTDLKKKTKILSICQKTEDKECKTKVTKSFAYNICVSGDIEEKTERPEIIIRKTCDTKKRQEEILFKVRGSFYMSQKRLLLKVYFQHTLNIQIVWKSKVFSPKKSAVLT